MKRKFIPILVLIPLFLVSCSLLSNLNPNKPLSDSEMATRVAQLLSTMTTPTSEIVFPPTATQGALLTVPTATPEVLVVASPTSTLPVGGELPTPTAVVLMPTSTAVVVMPTLENTPTSEATLEPSPTATLNVPAGDPINTLGNPSSMDTMDSSAKWAWPTGADDYVNVDFQNGFMLMTNLSKEAAGWRLPLIEQQVDSYIELTANSGTCTGKDSYGIIFRVPVLKQPDQGYLYQVTCDGYYRLWKWDGQSGTKGLATSLLNWKQSSAINKGANQTNRLGVMVVKNQITLYINGVKLGSVNDSSFEAGFFGAFVRSGGDANYTAKFDAMKLWENPVH
jgi:hypothetical protein